MPSPVILIFIGADLGITTGTPPVIFRNIELDKIDLEEAFRVQPITKEQIEGVLREMEKPVEYEPRQLHERVFPMCGGSHGQQQVRPANKQQRWMQLSQRSR